MKAPPFAYARPRSLSEVFQLLQAHREGAKLLAGGQSLLATLNLRLSAPDILIDITRIPELSGIKVAGCKVHVGALTTHAEIERSAEIAAHLPLLAQAAPHIAHVAIRNRNSTSGSIAAAVINQPAQTTPTRMAAQRDPNRDMALPREIKQYGVFALKI